MGVPCVGHECRYIKARRTCTDKQRCFVLWRTARETMRSVVQMFKKEAGPTAVQTSLQRNMQTRFAKPIRSQAMKYANLDQPSAYFRASDLTSLLIASIQWFVADWWESRECSNLWRIIDEPDGIGWHELPFADSSNAANLNDICTSFFHVVQPASLWIWSQLSERFRQYLQQNMDFRVSCSAWTFIFEESQTKHRLLFLAKTTQAGDALYAVT